MLTALEISERLQRLEATIPEGIELLAVSKFQPVEAIKAAYEAGQRLFGESRVQELLDKQPRLPDDIKWHFIGHLQTNKVKALVGHASLIESVDSARLLELIDSESGKKGVRSGVLLQVHVAAEETKFGFSPAELEAYVAGKGYETLVNTDFRGLMAMATNTDDSETVRRDFATAADCFRRVKALLSEQSPERAEKFNILSMGMSGDWPIAVEEGATLIRVGSAIFGDRY